MKNEKIAGLIGEAKLLKNYDDRAGGASDEEIASLEMDFGITLPNDYKYFLSNFGFASWFGGGVQGLPDDNYRFKKYSAVNLNTIHHVKSYEKENYLPVPKFGLVINTYDGGGYYFLFSKESERAGEVGLFLTETYGQEVSKFKSFTDYLSFLVTGAPDPEPVDVDYDKIMDIIED